MNTPRTSKRCMAAGLVAGVLALIPGQALSQETAQETAQETVQEVAQETAPDSLAPAPSSALPFAKSELPFAKNELPNRFPKVGVGAGLGLCAANLDDVERTFRALERSYASGGYPVPRSREPHLDPMQLWSVTMRLSRSLDLAVQLARAKGESDRLGTSGALLSHRLVSTANGDLELSAGLGGGTYGFSFNRVYGVVVSPTDANGGYYTLDRITLEGGGGYWTAVGGVTVRPTRHVSLGVQAQYLGMSAAEKDTRVGRVSIVPSGFVFGGSLTLFL